MSLIAGMDNVVEYIKKLEEKNKALERQLGEKTDEYNIIAFYNIEHKKQVIKLQEENKKMKDMLLKFKRECDEVKDEIKQLDEKTNIEKTSKQDTDEEELNYWVEDDDWKECYGGSANSGIKNGRYELVMAGGGSHWWNYVITKEGVFIEDTHGIKKIDKMLVSSPDSNYLIEKDLDYELKDEETNMYECIMECYEDEMNIVVYTDDDEYD